MKRLRDIPLTDWIIAAAAVIGIIVAIRQTGIAARQTTILDQQRQDAIDAGSITKAIAMYTEQYAVSMKANVAQAQTALETTTKQNQDALDKTIKQGQQSLDQSRRALDATLEVEYADKRAYIFPVKLLGPQGLEANKEVKSELIWKNYGKTAARRVEPDTHFWIQSPGPPQEPPRAKRKGTGGPIELGPGRSMQYFPTYKVERENWPDVASGRKLVFIHATFDYEDTIGEHWQAYVIAQYERDEWTVVDMGTKRQPHAEEQPPHLAPPA